MFSFVQSILSPRPNPIGIDFGTDALRMSQVQFDGNDFHLIAAATAPVPAGIRHDIPRRMEFFTQTVSDLLAQGKFKGRRAVVGLPSAWTFVRNFRAASKDDDSIKKGLPAEWTRELGDMHLRHIVAGELTRQDRSEWEVILMAAKKSHVDMLLAASGRARVDVRGLAVEMTAMVDCFAHVYRRKADANSTTCYLDIGCQGSRVVIARGGRIVFMRSAAVGGDAMTAAVATRLKLHSEDARLLRHKLSHAQIASGDRPAREPQDADGAPAASPDEPLHIDQDTGIAMRVEKAISGPLYTIVEELQRCLGDHDATFSGAPVDRVVLCGGEARNRTVFKYISAAMSIPTQVGDPMVRLSKSAQAGSGIDRRQPQPMWSVSLGLAMGPAKVTSELPASVVKETLVAAANREAA
jgi:type IV pilus assembly protein PilM